MCTCILIIALSVKIDTFNIYDYNLIYNQQFNNNICTQTFLKKKNGIKPYLRLFFPYFLSQHLSFKSMHNDRQKSGVKKKVVIMYACPTK